tara:strand:- start:1293 stop:1532 length:240 start_codon:yes stop_codon:yes gene_type:complete
MNNNNLINEYIKSLNELEKKALIIADKNLETSFSIDKSIGFIKYINDLERQENDMNKTDGVKMKALGFSGKKINDDVQT